MENDKQAIKAAALDEIRAALDSWGFDDANWFIQYCDGVVHLARRMCGESEVKND